MQRNAWQLQQAKLTIVKSRQWRRLYEQVAVCYGFVLCKRFDEGCGFRAPRSTTLYSQHNQAGAATSIKYRVDPLLGKTSKT
jgi:hypothetical protein